MKKYKIGRKSNLRKQILRLIKFNKIAEVGFLMEKWKSKYGDLK